MRRPTITPPPPRIPVKVLKWFRWRRHRIALVRFDDGRLAELTSEQIVILH